jgi:hypothetical protein
MVLAWIAVLAAGWATGGCLKLPSRMAVSPDGRKLYFCLRSAALPERQDPWANVYEFDVASRRLRIRGEGNYPWCDLSADGRMLLCMSPTDISVVDLQEGVQVPLSGMLYPNVFPRFVPGEGLHILCLSTAPETRKPQWVLYSVATGPDPGKGFGVRVPLPLPRGWEGVLGSGAAVSRNRFAVSLARKVEPPDPGEQPAERKLAVYVVTLAEAQDGESTTRPSATKATASRAGLLDAPAPAGGSRTVDLAFSSDGKRLVAAVVYESTPFPVGLVLTGKAGADAKPRQRPKAPPTKFYELDAAGRRPPRLLFEAPHAAAPQWTPDGRGIVFLRRCPRDENWHEVALWRPAAKRPTPLARLPGPASCGVTTWRWTPEGRLRIYHQFSDIRIVETAADGSKPTVRRLSAANYATQVHLANLEQTLHRLSDISEPSRQAPERLRGIHGPLTKALQEVKPAMEAAWDAADDWEPAPAAGTE